MHVSAPPMPRITLIQNISEDEFLTQVCVGRITWSARKFTVRRQTLPPICERYESVTT